MNYRKVKLKDICDIVKGDTGITKAIEGDYPIVTLAEERKSHNEYQFDTKAVIIPLVSSTGHGHASMKRIHYQEGKFALGSILCALVPKQDNIYDPEYLYYILDSNKENIFVPLMKGMANVSLPMKRIKEVEINLPSLDNQKRLVQTFSSISGLSKELSDKIIFQKESIKQLRQSILQLAVQGRLTANWRRQNPDVEPAKVLLEIIRAEKEQMIKEGKIKRQKPLPEIGEEEKGFELPVGWEWCRLASISNKIHYGFNASAKPNEKEIRLLRITDIQNNTVIWENVPGCDYTQKDIDNYLLKENDIVIARTGGTIGKSYIVKNLSVKSLFASYLIRAVPSNNIYPEYLKIYLETPVYWQQLYDYAWGAGQPNVNGTKLSNLVVSLPPYIEQKAIVEKTNQLMSWCDELEKKAQEREALHEKTMLAVVGNLD